VRFKILSLFPILIGLFGAVGSARGGDLIIRPNITISEEFNDNIYFSAVNKKSDFITRVAPGFNLLYGSPFWNWNVNAAASYLHFARNSYGDEVYPTVGVNGQVRLIENFLFLDIVDSYTRVPLRTAYDSLFANQSNQNFLSVSPYFVFHPKERLEVTTGYAYKNMFYDREGTINWQEHDLFLRVAHDLTPQSKIFANIIYAYTTTSDDVNYSRLTPSLGWEYTYADKSRIYLEGGYSFLFADGGSTFATPYWKAGINHHFGPYVATLDGGVTYNTDPFHNISEQRRVTASLTRYFPRGTVGISPFWSSSKDYTTDSVFMKSYGLWLFGTYKFTDKLEGSLRVGGGTVRGTTFYPFSYPYYYPYAYPYLTNTEGPLVYRIYTDAWLRYFLNNDLTLFLNYVFSTYLYQSGNSPNIYNNRVVIGLTKYFPEWKF
jgi:hypothetical protein